MMDIDWGMIGLLILIIFLSVVIGVCIGKIF